MDTDGVLQIGPTTEKQFGRAHYKGLLASFSGAQLLSGALWKCRGADTSTRPC